MRQLLMAALLVALAPAGAWAQTPPASPAPVGTGTSEPSAAPASPPNDDAAAPSAAPSTPTESAPAPSAPEATPAPTSDAPKSDAPRLPPYEEPAAGRLVSGAPLNDPNVAVHIVERKPFRDQGKQEITLYPTAVQTNVKFTEHLGTALAYTYHLHENFGLQVMPQYNWHTDESEFNRELITKVREEAQAATSLLLVYGAIGGVEVAPLYGKFAFYQGTLGQFTLVLNGGVGAGVTRHQLRPEIEGRAATYGDTGTKLMGSVGGGFRFQIGDRFALRLEVRDLVYTARVDSVNGCNLSDLSAMNTVVNAGGTSFGGVNVSPGCQVSKFEGTDPRTGDTRALDVPLAKALVETPTSDVLNNVGFYAGFSFLF